MAVNVALSKALDLFKVSENLPFFLSELSKAFHTLQGRQFIHRRTVLSAELEISKP
jgi:hypothetical protein